MRDSRSLIFHGSPYRFFNAIQIRFLTPAIAVSSDALEIWAGKLLQFLALDNLYIFHQVFEINMKLAAGDFQFSFSISVFLVCL